MLMGLRIGGGVGESDTVARVARVARRGLVAQCVELTFSAFLNSQDVKDVYETLRELRPAHTRAAELTKPAVLASRVHSFSEGSTLEPAALSTPESSFASVPQA
jgi:hypothetical protein